MAQRRKTAPKTAPAKADPSKEVKEEIVETVVTETVEASNSEENVSGQESQLEELNDQLQKGSTNEAETEKEKQAPCSEAIQLDETIRLMQHKALYERSVGISLIEGAEAPEYGDDTSEGMVAKAFIPESRFMIIHPMDTAIIPLGFNALLPEGLRFRAVSNHEHQEARSLEVKRVIKVESYTENGPKRQFALLVRNTSHRKLAINHQDKFAKIELEPYIVFSWAGDETEGGDS